MQTPRNAPCPCGSGKKFKQCHAAANHPTAQYSATDLANAVERSWKLIAVPEFEQAFEAMLHRLLRHSEDQELDAATLEHWFERPFDDLTRFHFALDHEVADGQHPVDNLLAAESLPPTERSCLQSLRNSCLAVYEVIQVASSHSISLRDLLTETPCAVELDRPGGIQPGDLILTRIIPEIASGWRMLGFFRVDPSNVDATRALVDGAKGDGAGMTPPQSPATTMKRLAAAIIQAQRPDLRADLGGDSG